MHLKVIKILTLLLFFTIYNSTIAQVGRPNIISVERFAGITSNGGSTFGDKLLSKLNEPIDMAITESGIIYVAEEGGSSIKKIDINGIISSFAGTSGSTGFLDATGTSARFNQIRGITLDSNENLIVADKENHAIRKVSPAGVVTTIAGTTAGFNDGILSEALFNKPIEVIVDESDNIYVADALNFRIRKIDIDGNVTTLVGRGLSGYIDGDIKTATLDVPSDFAFDSKGDLIIATYHAVRRFDLSTTQLTTIVGGATATTYADGDKATAGFTSMNGLLIDEGDIIYIVDRHALRHVSQDGVVTTIAGDAIQGVDNGAPLSSRFHFPRGIVKNSDGDFLIADKANHVIRKLILGPAISISSSVQTHNTTSAFEATFTFTKAVNNFTSSDIIIANGTISNFSGSGVLYTADITPTSNNTITIDVTAAAATDLADNPNTAALQFSVPLDQTNPVFTSATTATFLENGTGTAYTATATDDNTITYSLGTGNDERLFDINGTSGIVTFKSAPDFEAPADANTDNAYVIQVNASDGINTVNQTVTITVTNVDDTDPVFTSGVVENFAENGTGTAHTVAATDANTLTYSLGMGNDEALFNIVGTSGIVTFKASPDFEAPADADTNNDYVIEVKASDGINTANQTVQLFVQNVVDENPVFTSTPVTTIDENNKYNYIVTARGQDGIQSSITGNGIPSWLSLITNTHFVSTLAGSGEEKNIDGVGTAASFHFITHLSTDKAGNIYTTNLGNHTIRKVSSTGEVTTIAGFDNGGTRVNANGTNASFTGANKAIYDDFSKSIFVLDGSMVRKIDQNGDVSDFVGSGFHGFVDGNGTTARFTSLIGGDVDKFGNLYVADSSNHAIRKITPEGVVSTLAGNGSASYHDATGTAAGFNRPFDLTIDASGNIYVSDEGNDRIRKIDTEGRVTTVAGSGTETFADGTGVIASFFNPRGIDIDASNNLYVADGNNNRVRKITPVGVVTTIAGSGALQFLDGNGTEAAIRGPWGLALDGDIIYVTSVFGRVRKISTQYALTGDPIGKVGTHYVGLRATDKQGNSKNQEFSILVNDGTIPFFTSTPVLEIRDDQKYQYKVLATDPDGDPVNITGRTLPSWLKLVERIENRVTTLAGNGASGGSNGIGIEAGFTNPSGIAINSSGDLFVADLEGHVIRKVTSAGLVSTFAGSGVNGFLDGQGLNAQFDGPRGLTFDAKGNLYVADTRNNRIRKITPAGVVSTVAGSTVGHLDGNGENAKFNSPNDLTIDPNNNLFVSDGGNHRIRKIDSDGNVTTIAGSGQFGYLDGNGTSAQFHTPWGIAVDKNGDLYVAGHGDHTIRKITPSGDVSTLAGSGISGFKDGTGADASFKNPAGLTLGNDGNLYVVDPETNALRRITLNGIVSTIAGGDGVGFTNGIGKSATFRSTTDIEMDSFGNLFVADQFNHAVRKINGSGTFLEGNASKEIANGNITLKVDDGKGNNSEQFFRVIVKDVTAPTFTSAVNTSIIEGSNLPAYQATAKDFGTITYSLSPQKDGSRFRINAASGLLRFNTSPDFENPIDDNADNIYVVDINASDGINRASLSVSITVLNSLNEDALSFLSTPVTTISRDDQYSYLLETNNKNAKISATNLPTWLELKEIAEVTSMKGAGTAITQDTNGDFFVTSGNVIKRIDKSGIITTIAGSGDYGFADGTGTAASFALPVRITIGPDDNLYVADARNSRIRKVTKAGVVTTFAGAGPNGYEVKDGLALEATFVSPSGLAFDSQGNLFVSDGGSHSIRKIDTNGNVTTIAGQGKGVFINRGNGPTLIGLNGSFADGIGTDAKFNSPNHIAIDKHDNIFVADLRNNRIRKISTAGVVTTFAGSVQGDIDGSISTAQFNGPGSIAIKEDGTLFITEGGRIRMIDTQGIVSTIAGLTSGNFGSVDGFGSDARFPSIRDIILAKDSKLYIPEDYEGNLRKISLIQVLQGNPFNETGQHNVSLTATNPAGESVDQNFTLEVKDLTTPFIHEIVRINPAEKTIKAKKVSFRIKFSEKVLNVDHHDFQLSAGGSRGFVTSVTEDPFEESVYYINVGFISGTGLVDLRVVSGTDITDLQGNNLSNLEPTEIEEVYNIIGNNSPQISSDPVLEVNDDQSYSYPLTIVDLDYDLISFNNSAFPSWLRLNTERQVSTLAGSEIGYQDGFGDNAQFQTILHLATDRFGNSYVTESGKKRIRKVTPKGQVSTFISLFGRIQLSDGSVMGTSLEPTALVVDHLGNLIVAGLYSAPSESYFRIERISSRGDRQVIAGGPGLELVNGQGKLATFKSIGGLAIDSNGNIIVSDEGNHRIRKVTQDGSVTTIAGSNKGFQDGPSDQAKFSNPKALAIDDSGNIFVTDFLNHKVRKIDVSGNVSTLAGSEYGYQDGNGSSAKFSGLFAMTIDPQNNLIVSDNNNNRIRQIDQAGNVTTLAGSTYGFEDGLAVSSKFKNLIGIAMDNAGNIIVVDTDNSRLRKISKTYSLQGSAIGQKGSHSVSIVASDEFGESDTQSFSINVKDATPPVFTSGITQSFVENTTGTVYSIAATDLNAVTYSLGTDNDESFFNLNGDVVTFKAIPDFEVKSSYVIEVKANDGLNTASQTVTITITDVDEIVPVFTSATAINFTENGTGTAYTIFATDANAVTYSLGTGNDESFFDLNGGVITFKSAPDFENPTDNNTDNIYVFEVRASDGLNVATQKIYLSVVNSSDSKPIFVSTPLTSTNDNQEYSYEIFVDDPDGDNLELKGANIPNWTTLNIKKEGITTTIAGNGNQGFKNGVGVSASFGNPAGIVIDNSGNIYISDRSNHSIRKIDPNGVVSTFAGSGTAGFADGIGSAALFNHPTGLAIDTEQNIYVGDRLNNKIRKIKPDGTVSTLAGSSAGYKDGTGSDAKFFRPQGLTIDKDGNIYVADNWNNRIRKVSSSGEVTTFAGNGPSFSAFSSNTGTFYFPSDIVFDKAGNLIVADWGNNSIKKVSPTGEITTLAGTGFISFTNGLGRFATFYRPHNLAIDDHGSIYVTDAGNNRIRKISVNGIVSTVSGSGNKGTEDGVGLNASFDFPRGIVIDKNGDLLITDAGNSTIRKVTTNKFMLIGDPKRSFGTHNVSLTVQDPAGNIENQNFPISINDVTNPVFTSATAVNFEENGTGTAYTIVATDANAITYSLGAGNDEAFFDLAGGVVTFKSSPDLETKGTYTIQVNANDGLNTASQTVMITITDVDEILPIFTSATAVNFEENATGSVYTIVANDANTITYSLGTGNDESFFDLNGGVVTFKSSPDFETKNTYTLKVNANDGLNNVSQTVTITITDIDEVNPVFTSATAVNFVENGTGSAHTITATDASAVTYSLGTANDEALFDLTGDKVTFKASPDFEAPKDSDAKNTYLLEVIATDALGNTSSQVVTITVTDADEVAPAIRIASASSALVFTPTFKVTFTFSEPVIGFDVSDLTITNGSATAFTGSGNTYSALITATADGQVSVSLAKDKAEDAAGNNNLASNILSRTVEATNLAPSAVDLSANAVIENTAPPVEVGTLSAVDADENDKHAFALVGGEGSTDNGLFRIIDNKLIARSAFDYETAKVASVRIRATDARGLSLDVIKQIEVLNVAEPLITVFLPSIADPLIGDANLAFEAIRTGQTATRTLEVTNSGTDGDLSITDITLPAGFAIDKTTATIAQGQKEVLTVTFSPTEVKTYAGSIVISSNAGEKKVQVGGKGKQNRAPIAVSPGVEIFFKLSDLLQLRGYDPDGDAIEFVITQQPAHGTITATTAGLYGFVPNGLTPGQVYQDVLKFKVVETGGGLESTEAELKFKFKVRDQGHAINSLVVNSKTEEKMTFDLKFLDPALNDAYQLKVNYYDLSDPTSPVFVPMLSQSIAKSAITTTDGVHGFSFEATSTGHSYFFSASRVFMSVELTTANGYSASDGYILRNESSGANIGTIEGAGSEDGEFFVFASQSSVPENESVDVNLYAVELGSYSLSNASIEITKAALKGSSTTPIEVKKTDNLAQWKLTYASDTEVGLLDSLQFTVTHPDRSADADAYAKVEVIEVADAPTLGVIADQQTNEEETITLDLVVSDPDSELTITATSSESSNVPVTVSGNKLTITPGKDFNGTANISVLVTESNSESALSTFDEFQLTVIPVNDKPVMTAISDLTVAEDGQVVVTLSATDVDAELPIFTYAASVDNQDNVSYSLEGDVLTITPAANYNGTLNFGITADDGEGTTNSVSDSEAFTITVSAQNDAPTSSATINTQTLLEAIPAYTLDLAQYFTDVETAAEDLTYTVSSVGNADLSITGATLTITSVAGASGVEIATVTASDGELSVSQNVTFVATTANTEVTVANPVADQVLVEDFGLSSIDLSNVFALSTDANASFTYVLTGNNTIGASMNGSVLELTSVDDFNGADELIIIGTADGKSSFTSFKITVSPANDAPSLATAINDVSTAEDASLSQVISANAFSDVDGDVLSYSASYTAAWLSFDAATRTFSGTPANADVGTVTVTVTATDPSGSTATDNFDIVVSNTNDDPTAITFTSKLLDENIALSSVVSDLTSVDPDAGDDSFTYTLVSGTGDTDNGNFAIVGNQLMTASTVDFESKASYSIRIKTTDGFEGSFTEAVTLTVNNVNEVATDIDLPVTVIAENQTAGSVISTLATTDPDAADSHSYSLVSGTGDTDNGSFAITDGKLTAASAFDFETKSSYSVRIKTTDAAGLSFEKSFAITVTNVNEVATDLSLSAATIAENASISTEIADLTTTDPDAGDTHGYSLAAGEGDTDNANFKIEGAKLLAASSFNFENKSSYTIRLKSTDAAGLSFEKSFIVSVTDVNDAPSGLSADNLSIEENQVSGTTIGSLITTDQDNGDTHSYSLTSGEGDTDNASFTLDGNVLKAAASYDFETKDSYTVRVKTTDAAGLSFGTALTVVITNQAEAQMRLENNGSVDPTGLGTTTTFNITVFNDGDGAMTVSGITYPEGFSGASGISEIAPSASAELTISFSPTEVKTYSGNVILTYNGGEQAIAVSAMGEVITAIDDGLIDEALIKMYPNPATNEFTLDLTSFNGQPIKVSIVNGSGIGVYTAQDIRSNKHTVKVSNYSQGIYIVMLQSAKQLIQKKLVIRR